MSKAGLARLAVAAVLALGCAPASAGDDLERALGVTLASEGLTGVVYGVVDGDSTRIGAVGLAHHSRGIALRADARVHVGSVAKTLVALGMLRLVTQGRVALDAPLATLLPEMEFDNPWRTRRPVTLRHLLDHSAGLDDLRLWHVFTQRADATSPLAHAFRGDASLLRVRVEPGRRFSYSNMSYTLAAMVLERVTGERYERWLDRELLGPLGMTDSTFAFTSQSGAGADLRLAWGHHDDLTPVAAVPVWLRPATQFTTTAADMMRLARFLMSDGRIAGDTFVDAEGLRHMGVAWSTDAGRAGLATGYALGLAMRDRHGAVGRCHTGNVVGYRAAFCIFVRQRRAFFTAVNTDSESADYSRIDALVIESLGVSSPTAPAFARSPPARITGRYVRSPSRFEKFRYVDLIFDSTKVRLADGVLVLHRTGAPPQRLDPVGANLYRAPGRTQASHVFVGDTFSDGTNTWERVSGAQFATLGASLALGVLGLGCLAVLIPWRRLARREPAWTPATFALLLLLVPLPLFALQPFLAIGDATPASVTLWIATLLLPILLGTHAAWAVRRRTNLDSWRLHAISAIAALQWCVVLAVFGLLPFATWR